MWKTKVMESALLLSAHEGLLAQTMARRQCTSYAQNGSKHATGPSI